MKIENVSPLTITELWSDVARRIAKVPSLEQGAQALAQAIHEEFRDSVVVARVFVTVPFAELPRNVQEFGRGLAASASASEELGDATPVLSLIGTHGQEPDWCDRRLSKGHVGIPLITSAFVDGIPMIARLLRELGLPLEWVDTRDSDVIQRTIGGSDGLFFVRDAGTATDGQDRKVIAAQDFVAKYRVGSVIGVGGAYPNDQILVVVVFCRDRFGRETAEHFLPLATLFKAQTQDLVRRRRIFSDAD